MTEIQEISSLRKLFQTERIIGHLKGGGQGPTVVFFAGIHGNEPAGVFALEHIFKELRVEGKEITGEILGIAGNLNAFQKKMRFEQEDLNRIWLPDRIAAIQSKNGEYHPEEKELLELFGLLHLILEESTPPFYFIDLHTTSSDTKPFVVMNDSLLNRKFTSHYPLPIILGIEEYLVGALLSYINEMGYVSLGYESGQHNDPEAVDNCMDFIRFTLHLTASVGYRDFGKMFLNLKTSSKGQDFPVFYEIYYQHYLGSDNDFKMFPGFGNFQKIPKGTNLARHNGKLIRTDRERQIFMPLYQAQGSEGFYYIKPISKVLLGLSKVLRKLKVDHVLVKLPGVSWASKKKDTLVVNLRTARFMAKSFFHLLGYRTRRLDRAHYVMKSRETASKKEEYVRTVWYGNKK